MTKTGSFCIQQFMKDSYIWPQMLVRKPFFLGIFARSGEGKIVTIFCIDHNTLVDVKWIFQDQNNKMSLLFFTSCYIAKKLDEATTVNPDSYLRVIFIYTIRDPNAECKYLFQDYAKHSSKCHFLYGKFKKKWSWHWTFRCLVETIIINVTMNLRCCV